MAVLLTIKQAAEFLGVSPKTIRRWEKAGKIKSFRTEGGHRRFDREDLLKYKSSELLTVGYARTHKKKSEKHLQKQISCIKNYCKHYEFNCEIIEDVCSDINSKNRELQELIRLICNQQVKRLILTHQDKLLNPVDNLIITICYMFKVEVIILYASEEEMIKESLIEDFKDIIVPLKHHCDYKDNQTNDKVLHTREKII